MVADGVENAVANEGGQELLDEQGQEDGADGGQDKVVDHEQSVQLEGGQLLHDLTATEDDDVVGDQHGRGLLEGGHGGHALGELELAGGITHDLLVGLVEQGPQVDAKGPVQGGEGHILKEFGHGERGGSDGVDESRKSRKEKKKKKKTKPIGLLQRLGARARSQGSVSQKKGRREWKGPTMGERRRSGRKKSSEQRYFFAARWVGPKRNSAAVKGGA